MYFKSAKLLYLNYIINFFLLLYNLLTVDDYNYILFFYLLTFLKNFLKLYIIN